MKEYFEDLVVGMTYNTPGVTVTKESIIRFAMEYDFQPFHADEIAARDTMFGGLIASGMQTYCLAFKLFTAGGVFTGNAVAGLGIDEMRFIRPVRPDDTLRASATVTDLRPSMSRPDVGLVKWSIACENQNGQPVLTAMITNMILRRPASGQ